MSKKDIEEIVWKILERIFPKGYDIDAKLVEDLRVILTQHHEAEVERYKSLLKECEPFLSDHSGIGLTTLAYVSPAEQMRRAAERMEYESNLKERVNQALTPTKTDEQTDITSDK